jgi:hypothetical protein
MDSTGTIDTCGTDEQRVRVGQAWQAQRQQCRQRGLPAASALLRRCLARAPRSAVLGVGRRLVCGVKMLIEPSSCRAAQPGRRLPDLRSIGVDGQGGHRNRTRRTQRTITQLVRFHQNWCPRGNTYSWHPCAECVFMRQTIAACRDQAPVGSCKTFAVESSYVATGLVHSRRARPFCKDRPKLLYGYRDWGSSDPLTRSQRVHTAIGVATRPE